MTMLKKFSVTNFKNFESKLTLDLSSPSNYYFNTDVVSGGCVTKGIVYGINGSGKSNLGLAIFDIVLHLTDKEKLKRYGNYLSLSSQASYAEFEYTFSFYGKELIYQYRKCDAQTLLMERILIDGEEVLYYDFTTQDGRVILKGTETLNLVANSQISRVKYIRGNAIIDANEENDIFNTFVDFVDHMLLFYSLDKRGYQGFSTGTSSITQEIITQGKVKEFEAFLREQNINYDLFVKEVDDEKKLYCRFGDKEVNFLSIISTGTSSLTLFYYWYLQMQSIPFVFIDEFDAFYHFDVSAALVRLLRSLENTQVILTTHNTDIMTNDLLRPDCYFMLKEGTIAPLCARTEKDLRQAHNLQKMYKAGAFDE